VLTHPDTPIDTIMGWSLDSMKFKSSMTLFSLVSEEGSVFHRLLDHFFKGKRCPITLRRFGRPVPAEDEPPEPPAEKSKLKSPSNFFKKKAKPKRSDDESPPACPAKWKGSDDESPPASPAKWKGSDDESPPGCPAKLKGSDGESPPVKSKGSDEESPPPPAKPKGSPRKKPSRDEDTPVLVEAVDESGAPIA
jgi:hypothetical protein